MKTTLLLILSILFTIITSCSKKDSPDPREYGFFVKTIQLTYPNAGAIRASIFEYNEKNQIKYFEFNIGTITYKSALTYTDQDLISRVDMDVFYTVPAHNYGYIFEYSYENDILLDYKLNGTRYPVNFNAANKSYGISTRLYHWDVNNNLKKITNSAGGSTFIDINYLSGSGIFKEDKVQMALAIFSDHLARSSDPRPYHHVMEHFAFSKNEIGSYNLPDYVSYHLKAIRDDQGNINSYEIHNADGVLLRRYALTYEKRIINIAP